MIPEKRILDIMHKSACALHVSPDLFLQTSRVAEDVRARQILYWILAEHGMSRGDLARYFQKDHATISYHLKRVARSQDLLRRARDVITYLSSSLAEHLYSSLQEIFVPSRAYSLWCYLSDTVLGWEHHPAIACASGYYLLIKLQWVRKTVEQILRDQHLDQAITKLSMHASQVSYS